MAWETGLRGSNPGHPSPPSFTCCTPLGGGRRPHHVCQWRPAPRPHTPQRGPMLQPGAGQPPATRGRLPSSLRSRNWHLSLPPSLRPGDAGFSWLSCCGAAVTRTLTLPRCPVRAHSRRARASWGTWSGCLALQSSRPPQRLSGLSVPCSPSNPRHASARATGGALSSDPVGSRVAAARALGRNGAGGEAAGAALPSAASSRSGC